MTSNICCATNDRPSSGSFGRRVWLTISVGSRRMPVFWVARSRREGTTADVAPPLQMDSLRPDAEIGRDHLYARIALFFTLPLAGCDICAQCRRQRYPAGRAVSVAAPSQMVSHELCLGLAGKIKTLLSYLPAPSIGLMNFSAAAPLRSDESAPRVRYLRRPSSTPEKGWPRGKKGPDCLGAVS